VVTPRRGRLALALWGEAWKAAGKKNQEREEAMNDPTVETLARRLGRVERAGP